MFCTSRSVLHNYLLVIVVEAPKRFLSDSVLPLAWTFTACTSNSLSAWTWLRCLSITKCWVFMYL